MGNFRIWRRVEHIGVKQFVAIVSAVPDAAGDAWPMLELVAAACAVPTTGAFVRPAW